MVVLQSYSWHHPSLRPVSQIQSGQNYSTNFGVPFVAGCSHLENGCREELRNALISSRTWPRRSMIVSTSSSSACQSLPVHSGGISPAMARMMTGSNFSTRGNQGEKDSHPRTLSYTQLRA